jgi:hypothetical protein
MDVGEADTIISKGNHYWLWVDKYSGRIAFEGGNSPWDPNAFNDQALELDVWTHIAVVRTSETIVQFYINGLFDNEVTTYTATGGAGNLYIGSWGNYSRYFRCVIDELRILNRSLTVDEIYEDFIAMKRYPNRTGTVAWYHMDEGDNSTLECSSKTCSSASVYGAEWTTGFSPYDLSTTTEIPTIDSSSRVMSSSYENSIPSITPAFPINFIFFTLIAIISIRYKQNNDR